jgi:hypothetical protein
MPNRRATDPALDPPHDATHALRLVAKLVNSGGLDIDAVAHHVGDACPEHAELIGDTLLVSLRNRVTLVPALTAISAARACWPHVPHVACFGTEPDIAAMMDQQARRLLDQPDHLAERMLADPRGYFDRARPRACIEIEKEIAETASRRVRSH